MNRKYAIVDASSILGLRPTGVELLPETLRRAGLLERLNAEYCGAVTPSAPYDNSRDRMTKLLNPKAIKDYSIKLPSLKNTTHKNKLKMVHKPPCLDQRTYEEKYFKD